MLRIPSYNAIEAMDFEPRDSANRCTERPYRLLWSDFGAALEYVDIVGDLASFNFAMTAAKLATEG